MKTLKSVLLVHAFLFSLAAFATSPQFAVIQADKPSYTAGQTAAITVSVLIQPSNPDDEIVIIPSLPQPIGQIDATQLSASEWAMVTPQLNTAGNTLFEVEVYLQNKFQARNLNSTIAFYQQEIAQLQIQIQNTHDAGTIAALNAQITRDQGFIQVAQNQLMQIRRMIETDQFTLIVNPAPTPSPSSSPSNVIEVDSGSSTPYTGFDGTTWTADTGFSGGTPYSTTAAISGNSEQTSDQTLYQTLRYGNTFGYTFSVPNGTYSVTLKFAEIVWTATGKRIFNVSINGTQVLSNFDIFATAGGENIANDQTFTVAVTNGQIQIQFTTITDNAQVNAIKIVQAAKANETPSPNGTLHDSGQPEGSPAFYLDADVSNRMYTVGQTATFSVNLLTNFTGTDGPEEVVARAQVDGTTVSGVQGSSKEFSFESNPFTTAQVGPGTFTASVFVRSKAQADSLRDAIAQATNRKDYFVADLGSTSDPERQAFDKSEIHKLTSLINQFYGQLEGDLSLVGTNTLDFTVTPAKR